MKEATLICAEELSLVGLDDMESEVAIESMVSKIRGIMLHDLLNSYRFGYRRCTPGWRFQPIECPLARIISVTRLPMRFQG